MTASEPADAKAGALCRARADPRPYLRRLSSAFGWRIMAMLASAVGGVGGILYAIGISGMLPYYRDYMGLQASDYQSYVIVAYTPWTMKGIFGAMSDSTPLMGWHKTSYIFSSAFIGTAAFLLLAFLPLSSAAAGVAAVLFFAGQLECALIDILCQGRYGSLMRDNPETGADMITWVNTCMQLGSLTAFSFLGPMVDAVDPRYLFLVAAPCAAQVLVPTSLGFFGEARLPKGRRGLRCDIVAREPRLFALAVVMAGVAVGIAALNLAGVGEIVRTVYVLTAGALLCAAAFCVLPRTVAKCNMYMYLADALYINIDPFLDYYYVAGPECVDGGPNFSYTYYITWVKTVGAAAGGVGVVLFQSLMGGWKFRSVFLTTAIIRITAAAVDITIIERWNISAGIPDKFAFMTGAGIVYQVCYMMQYTPAVVLTSKLCPTGVEATMYAVLAGFQNIGTQTSSTLGVQLMSMFDIRLVSDDDIAAGDECHTGNLSWAVFTAHMVFPLLYIPLIFVLIPDARMTDQLVSPAADGGAPSAAPGTKRRGRDGAGAELHCELDPMLSLPAPRSVPLAAAGGGAECGAAPHIGGMAPHTAAGGPYGSAAAPDI